MRTRILSVALFACLAALSVNGQQISTQLQQGHRTSVKSVKISPDGRAIASLASAEKVVHIWDLKTGRKLRSISGTEGEINSFDYSADGKSIFAASMDQKLRKFNVFNGKEEAVGTIRGFADNLLRSPDGKFIVGLWGTKITIWDAQTVTLVKEIEGIGPAFAGTFSTDARLLFTGGSGGALNVYDLNTFQHVSTLKGHKIQVTALAFHKQRSLLASADENGVVKVWDVSNFKELKTVIKASENIDIISLAFSDDGKYLVSGETNNRIRIFETGGWTTQQEISIGKHWAGAAASVQLTPDFKFIICGYQDRIKVIDRASGKPFKEIYGSALNMENAVLSHDGKFAVSNDDNVVKLWDLVKAKPMKSYKANVSLYGLALTHDDAFVAGINNKDAFLLKLPEMTKVWDFDFGEELTFTWYENAVLFSPDNKYLLIGTEQGKIIIIEAATGKLLRTVNVFAGKIACITFVNGGSAVLVGGEDYVNARPVTLVQVSFPDGKLVQQYPTEDNTFAISLLANKPYDFVAVHSGKLMLWKLGQKDPGVALETKSFTTGMDITVTLNQNKMAVANMNGTIDIWDLGTLKHLTRLPGSELGDMRSLSYTPDNKFLVAVQDRQIKFFDASSNKEIVSLLTSPGVDLNFAAYTPEGYYYSSKGKVLDYIHFVKDYRVYSFDQFDLRFNRPDIILSLLGKADNATIASFRKAYEKRLRKLGFNENEKAGEFATNVPEVSLPSVSGTFLKSEVAQFKFDLHGNDKDLMLDRFHVFVNNIPVYGTRGYSVKDRRSRNITIPVEVELSAGRNKIEVSVSNEQGIESLRESFEVHYDVPALKPALYIFTMGISDFADDAFDLTYAAKDAEDLANLMKENVTGFSKIESVTLTNAECTRENIVAKGTFLKQAKPDDIVVVFVASHGLLDNNLDYFIGTSDIDFNNPAGRGLPYDALEGLLDEIPSRKKLMLIDACHSGEVDKEEVVLADNTVETGGTVKSRGFKKAVARQSGIGLQNTFDLMNELFADIRRGTGAVVISSASGTEFAFESSEWKNGVFTYSLLEGLRTKNADLDKKDGVTVTELRDYVIQKVTTLTNGKQHPTSRRENLEFDFNIW